MLHFAKELVVTRQIIFSRGLESNKIAFRLVGAFHHHRWMTKAIKCLKIFIFRNEFESAGIAWIKEYLYIYCKNIYKSLVQCLLSPQSNIPGVDVFKGSSEKTSEGITKKYCLYFSGFNIFWWYNSCRSKSKDCQSI